MIIENFTNTIYSSGFRQFCIYDPLNGSEVPVAAWYPTSEPEKSTQLGPFTLDVAMDAIPVKTHGAAILISHGSGSGPMGYKNLARYLATLGYFVFSPLHPKDNWKDRSGVGSYQVWTGRPLLLSSLLTSLQTNKFFSHYLNEKKVGFYGHSTGGYAGLMLACGKGSIQKLINHCYSNEDDQLFCQTGGVEARNLALECPELLECKDARIKAIAVAAPIAIHLDEESLKKVNIPILLLYGDKENLLNNKYHINYLQNTLSPDIASFYEIKGADHFSFIERISTQDATDSNNFDSNYFHQLIANNVSKFFTKSLLQIQ